MAIYDKHGKTIITESIQIDDDCYFGDKVIKVLALVKGESSPRLFYVSDLLADDGKKEINNIIAASLDKQ